MKNTLIQNKKHFGFTLVELLISLIVISLVAAAFVPVISKKLKNGTLSIGVGSGGGGGNMTLDCMQFGEACKFCSSNECYLCTIECSGSQKYLNQKECTCSACASISDHIVKCDYDKSRKIGVATLCEENYYIETQEGNDYGKCVPCPDGYICHGEVKANCEQGDYMNVDHC